MKFNSKDVKFEACKGTGPGGQHKNKTESAIRATHIPTGIQVFIQSERSQHANKRIALIKLALKVVREQEEEDAAAKKDERNRRIKETKIIRTYNFSKGWVKDHRSGKKASIKDVMMKGKLDLLK